MLASRQTVGCAVLLAGDADAVVFFITSVVNTLALKINDFVFHTVAFNHVLTLVGVGDLIVFIVDVVLNMVAYVATVALVDDDVIVDVVLTVVVDVVLTVVGAIVFLDKEDAIGFVAAADGESLGVGCCCKCRCSCRCSCRCRCSKWYFFERV